MTASVERPVGRREFLVEVAVAGLLGLGAILIAWASYQGSLHGGAAIQEYSRAVRTSDAASQRWNDASQVEVQDQALFLEYAKAAQGGDAELLTYLHDVLMRPDLAAAIDWWLQQPAESQPDSPFVVENAAYMNPAAAEATALDDEAEAQFANGAAHNDKGDQFGLVTTIVALALFLLGLAAVFNKFQVRVALAVAGGVVLVVAAVQLVGLGPYVA